MTPVTITLGVIGAVLSLVCWYSFIGGATQMVRSIRIGRPDPDRFAPFWPRLKTLVVEVLAHTRMNRFRSVGWAHWLVMVGFLLGAFVWFEAYIQTFNPHGGWPIVSNWTAYHLVDEVLGLATVLGILTLIIIRQRNSPTKADQLSRFTGSDKKAAYFVETVVFLEGLGMIMVKSGKLALADHYSPATDFVTGPISTLLPSNVVMVSIFAFVKLMSGMIWLYVVGRNIAWGVAWHRFAAFFNIYFKREDDGDVALGALRPILDEGRPLDLDKVMEGEYVDENGEEKEPLLGVGQIENFTWKGWLDFTTCTECGRCQSQCPAWNTGKPLSPKLMIMSLRDHAQAKAPYLLAGGRQAYGEETGLVDAEGEPDATKLARIPEAARVEAQRPLVGEMDPDGDLAASGIIDPEALWSCTTCGACVEQCPVDIEHVDHFIDMRRYQVLIESDFPTELAGLFKKLEQKGNPWGQAPAARGDWIKEMDFDIPVFGQDVENFDDTEYLFWVGCAGAYEDSAKKTTKAVAELLHTAGVKYMVLSTGETCTGDSARRAGNEFLFHQLATQNVETLDGVFDGVPKGQRKIVVTCAHCFNALKNEYPQLGGHYDVVHHTQLLNRLVRDKRLVPIQPVADDVTYHDPCYLGRHNKVYEAPRELMARSGAVLTEMPRHGQRSMCCGAGGARMWMEEQIGKRINVDRVDEALSTEPKKIATGCPFCRVMLTDGVTARTDEDAGIEVVDVSQLLLTSVSRDGGLPEPRAKEFLETPRRGRKRAEIEADEAEKAAAQPTIEETTADSPDAAAPAPAEAESAPTAVKATAAAPKLAGPAPGGAPKTTGGLTLGGAAKAPGTPAPKTTGGLTLGGAAKAPAGAKSASTPADPGPAEPAAAESAGTARPGGAPRSGGGLSLGGGSARKAGGGKLTLGGN